jgi:hypothetical protein
MYRMKKSKKTGRRTKVEKTPATIAKEMNKLLDASLAQIKDKKLLTGCAGGARA